MKLETITQTINRIKNKPQDKVRKADIDELCNIAEFLQDELFTARHPRLGMARGEMEKTNTEGENFIKPAEYWRAIVEEVEGWVFEVDLEDDYVRTGDMQMRSSSTLFREYVKERYCDEHGFLKCQKCNATVTKPFTINNY